ncbi:acyl-CoA thioesterase [Crateriforma conspicua]|uniref:Acyl-ACP thioesterase n=1 Tax=Crateriforma conspicua TaxID=2527996 RepID=A0A5C5XSD4_9PLAN|nr:acyl-CoA thioesterase [Crateriforma conspicua]TWT65814.1 Acyl-ACP thioesterase [Crateriforma conspicua]
MPSVFDLHHVVEQDEIDAQEHVHNLRYLQWTLWAARDHSASTGWDAAAELKRGFGWVVRQHEVTYRAAALVGDQLVIRTWISEKMRMAIRRKYLICRPADRMILARVQTRWVLADLRVRKAVSLPDEVYDRMVIPISTPTPPWS